MYRLILTLVVILAIMPFDRLHAQSRDLGAQRIWLDDNAGHRLLLQFPGPIDGVVTFPSGQSTTITLGAGDGQTLRWNGSAWIADSLMLNDGTTLTLRGQLISLVPQGTPAFTLSSTTVIPNLNADMIDGMHIENLVSDSLSIGTTLPLSGGGPLSGNLNLVLFYDSTLALNAGNLGLNLANPNTWSAAQLLPASAAQGDNLIAAINTGTSLIAMERLDSLVIIEGDIGAGLSVSAAGILSNSGVLTVTGTAGEIDATPASGNVILSLPDTITANITGNASTATTALTANYADSAGRAGGLANTPQSGNTVINAINSADSGVTINASALDPMLLLQTEVLGTANEIDVDEAGGILTLSLPVTINADLNGNAMTAYYADSAGRANSLTNSPETGNTVINAINSATTTINATALDSTVLLQTEVIGTANEIDVNESGGILTLSLPLTINADLNGNALTAYYADSAGRANALTNSPETGNTVINAINSATTTINATALDSTVLLQTEVIGTANEIVVTNSAGTLTLSLPDTINAFVAVNASTLTGVIDVANGGTGISSYTEGDILYADTTNSLTTLPIGSENQVLYVTSGKPAWGSVPAAGAAPYAINPGVVMMPDVDTFLLADSIVNYSTVVFLMSAPGADPVLTLADGVTPGQLLVLINHDDGNFHIHNVDNIIIKAPNQFAFSQHGDNITFLWCGTEWVEIARTDI